MATIKGITIEIGGDTQKLNKALEGVNKQSRDIQGELKQVDRLLKLDPKNTELLSQKQKLLAEAVSNSKTKLDTLKEAEKQVQQQFKEGKVGEEQYRLIQREVIATEQNLKNLEASLEKTNRDWEAMGKSLQDAGGKMKDIGGKMSVGVTAPIVAAGAAGFAFAADLEDAMGASDQIFKGASGSIKTWADSLDSYYGIAESEALTYANTMGAMLQNIGGLSEAEASKQSQTLVELAGDLTAMFGGTTESAVQALTGALKGNTAMLDNYGMGVNDATIKAKALEMGLYDGTGAMDLQTKQAATLALIMEQTADAQGQAARESEGASGTMRAFQTEIKNIATEIGEVLLPIITPFIAKAKEMAQRFGELSPEAQKVIIVIAGIAAAIGPLLMVIGSIVSGAGALIGVFGALSGPIGIVIAAIVALVAAGVLLYKNWDEIKAWAADLGTKIAEAWEGIKAKTEEIWSAVTSFLGGIWDGLMATGDSVFSAIQSAIESATLAIQKVITTVWNAIKAFLDPLWNTLKIIAEVIFVMIVLIIQTAMETIQTLITTIWTAIKNFLEPLWNTIKTIAETIFNAIKAYFEQVLNFYKTIFETVWNAIKTFLEPLWNAIKATAETVFNAIKDFFGVILDAIKGVFETTWNAIKSFLEPLWNNIKTIAETVFNSLKDFLSGTLDSIQIKFSAIWGSIKTSTASAWDGIKNTVRTAVNGILGFINSMIRAWNGISFQVPQVTVPFVGTFGGFRVGTIQIPEIPMLAKGGLVTKEMLAMVGDGGPEAVIPLNELKKMVAEIASNASGGRKRVDGIVQHITVQSPTALSPSETARQIKNASRRLALEW